MTTAQIPMLPAPGLGDTAYSDAPVKVKKTEMRVLSVEEVKSLAPIFERAGAALPDPSSSFIIGILEDGIPTESFLTIQACIHGEPMNIAPRHRTFIKSLVHFAENEVVSRAGIQNVFIFVPPNEVKQLAETFGFDEQPWRVLSKMVGPIGEPS